MSKAEAVLTEKAPKPLPQFSQAIKYNGMVYCSGNIGVDPTTSKFVEGTVKDRTVSLDLERKPRHRGPED
jgi:enamine deaminase RidA (YjgF/YER057c/UK114 family)